MDLEAIRTWRRALHQIPETELNLPQTKSYLKKQLEGIDACIIDVPSAGSSFLLYFDAGKEQSIAFRTDMDALPIGEQTEHDFKSLHEGKMHACGHDGHMSIMLTLAWILHEKKEQLKNNVLLIFQAGEETPGGAELICKEGYLENFNVKTIYGMHLWPMLPAGTIAARPLEMMAQSCEVHIHIQGLSAHAARYKEGHDAMEAGAHMLLKMYELEKRLPPDQYRLLRFGIFEAGTACNIVSDQCRIEGTLRSFLDPIFVYLKEGIEEIARDMEKKYKVKVRLEYSSGYPAVINDVKTTNEVLAKYPWIQRLEEPEMISEDFSFYQKKAPGVFFFLGTGTGIPLHNAKFDFNEEILLKGVDLFERLAFEQE